MAKFVTVTEAQVKECKARKQKDARRHGWAFARAATIQHLSPHAIAEHRQSIRPEYIASFDAGFAAYGASNKAMAN